MKKKQFMSKLAALTMAAAMGVTALPVSVFAASAVPVTTPDDNDAKAMAAAIKEALPTITVADDADGESKASGLVIGDIDVDSAVTTAAHGVDAGASVAIKPGSTATYNDSLNQITATLQVSGATTKTTVNGDYTVVLDVANTKEIGEAKTDVEKELKKLDLTYNDASAGKYEQRVKSAAEEALATLDSGLSVDSVTYNAGTHGSSDTVTFTISGTYKSNPVTSFTVSLDATSADASTLDAAATALSSYKSDATDTAVTEDQISEEVQAHLDKYAKDNSLDFDKVTFTLKDFKKTDDAVTAEVVLAQGSATKSVKLNKAIDKTALAQTALSGITTSNLADFKAGYNFTKDTDGVATGLDSDALAAVVKKSAEKALKDDGYTGAVANVTITVYGANDDTSKGNVGAGYAAGTITVTRNGVTSAAKIFKINATLQNGSYVYDQTSSDQAGDVHSASILAKSDNQKIASAVDTLDKAVKKDAALKITNSTNKNVPLTKKEVHDQAVTKITATLGSEGVVLKYAADAKDDTKVDTGNTDAKAVVVKSYTAPTTDAEGTAVITVNYNIAVDGTTKVATDPDYYVAASHDITLTFPKLSARKTTAIDPDATEKIELTMNAADTYDAKDNFTFNGNSALTWTSSDESVFTVDADGNLSPVGIGEATLTVAVTDNDSVKATKTVKVTGTTAFKDVQNPKAWYYNAIYNLANKKNAKKDAIVQGIAKDEFGVSAPINRAQFVTFLYRLADEPAVTATTQFTDVDASAYYAKAVAWAVQKGITDGKTDTTFDPNATVSRAEAVTFLYRYKGEPDYNSNIVTAFTDLNSSAYYYDAVQWATGTVTNGKTSTTFAPNDPCTRAEGITMIYRTNSIYS